jgi:beta-glucosidase/6-phospho-beta-glucosidase/beta-galactosidase
MSNTSALLPDPFTFGVATAGFQIEGGYNGPGEPTNNWAPWEHAGRVEPSGNAVGFWDDYEAHLDRAAAIGLDSFRLSIEWARCFPARDEVDEVAVEHYQAILRAIHARSMTPLVTLHHFTHPGWLPVEFWTLPNAPEEFTKWVRFAVSTFGAQCSKWITTNELNIYSVNSFLTGIFPPGWRGKFTATMASIDHLLTGHVLAYDIIHELQPDAVVATNNYSLSIYELDRMPLDLLVARAQGVAEAELGSWLAMRRRAHYELVPSGPGQIYPLIERGLREWAAAKVDLATALPRARSAIYASDHLSTLDVAQLDYYAPVAAEHLVLPGSPTTGGRYSLPARYLWDDRPDGSMFTTYCLEARDLGLPLWIVENGLCNRVVGARSYPRADGYDRPKYLAENLGAIVDAIQLGVDVRAYFHWTLVDNYEWGSYEPRFGLYGCDRPRGNKVTDLDAMGRDSAGAFKTMIAGLRGGDASVIGR